MRRFFVKQELAEGLVEITGAEAYHMQTVLRLAVGDVCVVVNNLGQRAKARVVGAGKNSLTLEIGEVAESAARPFRLTILQGFLKERKLDDLVRPLSELGVAEFGAVFTERSVPSPDEKRLAGRIERWRKLSVEALKQSRNDELMQIAEVCTFEAALQKYAQSEVKLFLWEGAAENLKTLLVLAEEEAGLPHDVVVLLGPEGGFTEREALQAKEKGFVAASLGPRILRSQTAALAAAAITQYVWGDLG